MMRNLIKSVLFTKFSSSKRKISNSPLPILTTSSWLFALLPLKSFYWRVEETKGKEIMDLCFILLSLGSLSSPDGILFRRNQWVRQDMFPVQALVRYSITQGPYWKKETKFKGIVSSGIEFLGWILLSQPCQLPCNLTVKKEKDSDGGIISW